MVKSQFIMRSISASLTFGASILLSVSLAWAAMTVDQVIQMHKLNLGDAAIIAALKSQNAVFNLTLDDIKKLKKAGVSQSIIDTMMPQKTETDEPEPEAEPEPETEDPEAAARQAEKERLMKEAAARYEAEEKARLLREIESKLEASETELNVEALKGFENFLQGDGSKSPEGKSKALFGYAEALFGLNFYANAMVQYEEILQTPPEDNPVFEKAFNRFRQCTQKISYDGLPGVFTEHYVGNFSQTFQDSYHYFLGKLFYNSNDFTSAQVYLEKVSNENSDYARAQYIMGVMAVTEAGKEDLTGLIKANRFFTEAITIAELPEYRTELSRVIDLSYLSLARIAYTLGNEGYDAALFYYRKIPTQSTHYIEALYESAWAYFLKGNIKRGMGIFNTLDAPDWENYYLLDVYLLEAQVFLNLCNTDIAKMLINRIKNDYLPLQKQLDEYMTAYDENMYEAFVKKKLKNGFDLDKRLYYSVISDTRFFEVYSSISRYIEERNEIEKLGSNFGEALSQRLNERAQELIDSGVELFNQVVLRILGDRKADLEKLREQVLEMEVEIEAQVSDQIEKKIESGYKGQFQSADEAQASQQQSASLLVGEKYLTWPFETEYWADEVNHYRSYLTSQCKDEEE